MAAHQLLIPSLYVDPGLLCFSYKIQHLCLLNFMQLVIAKTFNLPKSLCKASVLKQINSSSQYIVHNFT